MCKNLGVKKLLDFAGKHPWRQARRQQLPALKSYLELCQCIFRGELYNLKSKYFNAFTVFVCCHISVSAIQKFPPWVSEKYNLPFKLSELKNSLDKSHDTTAGPDDIHYQILKHLPSDALETLLNIMNEIWRTGKFPEDWHKAVIIPIPKPGKDKTEATNYRPIALTSCICKTMERMINDRLVWFLESNNLISGNQADFRKNYSTNDHLVRLESFIRDAFIKKEHCVAIFFDLEKAYDTTWKYGIMKDLHDIGLRG